MHVPREEAMQDLEGKIVNTMWVQSVKGVEVRRRLGAQEVAKGDPRENLFAGTPHLLAARLLVEPNFELDKTKNGHSWCWMSRVHVVSGDCCASWPNDPTCSV